MLGAKIVSLETFNIISSVVGANNCLNKTSYFEKTFRERFPSSKDIKSVLNITGEERIPTSHMAKREAICRKPVLRVATVWVSKMKKEVFLSPSLQLHKEKKINNVLVYLCLETECTLFPLGENKPVTWASD